MGWTKYNGQILIGSKVSDMFLSDLSPIMFYPCHLTHSLTNSLAHCCLVDLTDVILACEDANSKLVEDYLVAELAGQCVDDSLVHNWRLKFVPTLSTMFDQDFEVEVQGRF